MQELKFIVVEAPALTNILVRAYTAVAVLFVLSTTPSPDSSDSN